MFRRPSRIEFYMTPLVWLSACFLIIVPVRQHADAFLVLCIGTDGHVKMEIGRADISAPLEYSNPTVIRSELIAVADATGKDASHCGPCIDLFLTFGSLGGQSNTSIKVSPTYQTVLLTTSTVDVSTDDQRFLPAGPGVGDYSGPAFFEPLNSVHLLI